MADELNFYKDSRLIGNFTPDVVLEEVLEDQLDITSNPVENGSEVTDHAIIKPTTVKLDVCFMDYGVNNLSIDEMYNAILDLMAMRIPFDIVTTRRMYTNMMFTRIQTTTNKDTQNILRLTLEFKQVNLVSLQSVAVKTPQNEKASTSSKGQIKAQPQKDAAMSQKAEATAKANESENSSALYKMYSKFKGGE